MVRPAPAPSPASSELTVSTTPMSAALVSGYVSLESMADEILEDGDAGIQKSLVDWVLGTLG